MEDIEDNINRIERALITLAESIETGRVSGVKEDIRYILTDWH